MFHIILVSPEIPPNTGNAIRLAANTGVTLHLVKPLGFELNDSKLKRAGLDYHEWAAVQVHESLEQALASIATPIERCFAMSSKAASSFSNVAYQAGDVFVFGRETAGLTQAQLASFREANRLKLPMRPGQRSLNLSNAVAVTVFEAWRQCGYAGSL